MPAKLMQMKTVYYNDEHNDEFSSAQIKAIPIDEHYRYGTLTPLFRFIRLLYYRIFAMPIAWTYLKLKWHHKIIGRKEVRCRLKEHSGEAVASSSPASSSFAHSQQSNPPQPPNHSSLSPPHARAPLPLFVYANHTNPIADALIPTFVCLPRGVFVIVHANNVSIPVLGQSTKYLGALPLPDNGAAARNFSAALADRVRGGAAICIYPEAHIWPYCTWVRDFPDVSFRYPVQYDAGVVCFTNTYQRRGRNGVKLITYVDGPFFPDKSLPPKERRHLLRDEVYRAMTARAKMSNVDIVKYVRATTDDGGEGT